MLQYRKSQTKLGGDILPKENNHWIFKYRSIIRFSIPFVVFLLLFITFFTIREVPIYESLYDIPINHKIWIFSILFFFSLSVISVITTKYNKMNSKVYKMLWIISFLILLTGFSVSMLGLLIQDIHIPLPVNETLESMRDYREEMLHNFIRGRDYMMYARFISIIGVFFGVVANALALLKSEENDTEQS